MIHVRSKAGAAITAVCFGWPAALAQPAGAALGFQDAICGVAKSPAADAFDKTMKALDAGNRPLAEQHAKAFWEIHAKASHCKDLQRLAAMMTREMKPTVAEPVCNPICYAVPTNPIADPSGGRGHILLQMRRE